MAATSHVPNMHTLFSIKTKYLERSSALVTCQIGTSHSNQLSGWIAAGSNQANTCLATTGIDGTNIACTA
jgi:hypothetical protein